MNECQHRLEPRPMKAYRVLRIQVTRGLIQKQNLRLVGKSARDRAAVFRRRLKQDHTRSLLKRSGLCEYTYTLCCSPPESSEGYQYEHGPDHDKNGKVKCVHVQIIIINNHSSMTATVPDVQVDPPIPQLQYGSRSHCEHHRSESMNLQITYTPTGRWRAS